MMDKVLTEIKDYISSKLTKSRQPEQYFFMHIPKTAGTSLRSIIESQFSPDQINEGYNSPSDILNLTKEQLSKVKLIRGHYVYSIVNYLPRRPITITMLREPVSRAISHINHIKHDSSFHLHKHLPLDKMTIKEMLEESPVRKFVSNHQVRYFVSYIDLSNPKNPEAFYPFFLNRDYILGLAKERLASFDFIGITEEFDKSIKLLIKQFDWGEPDMSPKLNATSNYRDLKESPPDSVLGTLRELTALDRELYDFACKLFHERYNKTFPE